MALCDEPAGACPTVDASESTAPGQSGLGGGNRIVFTVPVTLNPGYFTVRVRSAAGNLSSEARWLLLADPSPVVPALAPEQHGLARPITSGQTVTGTFLENGDTSGSTNDFNLYYLVAAAGTRVSVRLERADASLPWEHPDSLDPQIALIAPDGFVYENEGSRDVTPATDLNAEVTNLLLPQTGMWLIAASTTRGHGDYRLSYTMTPPGSVPADQQIVAFAGRGTTARVGTDVRLTLAAMDTRGYLLSGAGVSFTATYPDAGAGTVEWPTGRSTFTAVDGLAQQRVRTTTRGAVDIAANFNGSSPTNAVFPPDPDPALKALVESTLATLPQYQPLEHHPYSVRNVDPDGNVTLNLGPVRTFKPSRPSRLRTEWKSGPGGGKTLNASSAPMPELEPDAVNRPLPYTESLVAPTCTAPTVFRHVAGDVPEFKTPYTVTLEDLTPRIGETLAPGLVGAKGIEGHRIEKTIRLKVDVKDRDGNPPPHPVLLRLSVGGPRSGRLIVGPAGAQLVCKEAYVVWHEADSQGNPGTEPVTFDYELGTLSLLPGVEPDPEHPGQVKPIWGVTEVLDITTEVITSEATLLSLTTFPVLPQPGRPQSLVDWDGPPEDDRWEWWNGYHTYYDSTRQARAVSLTNYNAYTLVDKYRNTVWGCRDTTTQHGGSRLTVDLPYQDLTGPDFRAYALKLQWWADGSGQMPQGATSVGLRVSYPESPGDWAAGEVATSTLIDLQGGPQTHLKRIERYEARFGMDDGTFPISVSPTARDEAIPNVEPGPAPAPTRSLESHRRMALVLLTGTEAPSMREVFRAPHHPWEWTGGSWVERPAEPAPDPRIDVAARPRLKLKLIDANGYVQTNAGFKVHLCPRFDHEGSPAAPEWACPTEPVSSANGVIGELSMNPGVVGNGDPPSPDATGYLGLELTTAPTAPGTYYVYVESLDKDVKIRDQSSLHLDDTPEGQFQGGFALCRVTGAEILDQNFQRVNPIPANGPTRAYVRLTDTSAVGGTVSMKLSTTREDGAVLTTETPVTLTRLASSRVFLGPFTLVPDDQTPSSARTLRAGEEPDARIAVGLTQIEAVNSSARADGQSAKRGRLRLRFLKRDAPDSCFVAPTDACLTAPDPAIPSSAAGSTQETHVDDSRNYAERIRLLVDVIDDEGAVVPYAKGDLAVSEIPNPLYEENPGSNRRRLFYDGKPDVPGQQPDARSSAVTPDGLVDGQRCRLSDGHAVVTLFSIAEAKYLADPPAALVSSQVQTVPYTATIFLESFPRDGRVDRPAPSDPRLIGAWVDERAYVRTRENPSCDPAWSAVPLGSASAPDWLEMRALDFYRTKNSSDPEVDTVFRQVQSIELDLTRRVPGSVYPLRPQVVTLNPFEPYDRYDTGEGTTLLVYHGLQQSRVARDVWKSTLAHEARHSWQLRLPDIYPTIHDEDKDHLPVTPPISSPELRDARYVGAIGPPGNLEFDFKGDSGTGSEDWTPQPNLDKPMAPYVFALDRNAMRFSASLFGDLVCAAYGPISLDYWSANGTVVASVPFQRVGREGGEQLNGAMFRVESAPVGTACTDVTGVWSTEAYVMSYSLGTASSTVPPNKTIRVSFEPPFRVVQPLPARCLAPLTQPSCVSTGVP